MPFGPLATAGGGGGAPDDAQYVVMVANATLTQERILTGTAFRIVVTDGGAGLPVTLSPGALIVQTDQPNTWTVGSQIIQPAVDTTTAFQVFDADGGAPVLSVDTINERVGIGVAAPGAQLQIDTSGPTVIGQIIKLDPSQSEDAFQVQKSDGTVFSGFDERGILFSDGNTDPSNFFAGDNAGDVTATGVDSIGIGDSALLNMSSGSQLIAIGTDALRTNSTGARNTAVGFSALRTANASFNNAIGYDSLRLTTTGSNNNAMGYRTLRQNIDGSDGNAMGYQALQQNTSGAANCGVGSNALNENQTGHRNTAIGGSALQGAAGVSVTENVGIGFNAGETNEGDYNVLVGAYAGENIGAASGVVFIGNQAGRNENVSNKLYIANTNTATPLIYGEFDNHIFRNYASTALTTTIQVGVHRLAHVTSGVAAPLFGISATHELEDAGGVLQTASEAATLWAVATAGSEQPLRRWTNYPNGAAGPGYGGYITADDVDNVALTIIPNGAGDVTTGLEVLYFVSVSDGNTAGGNATCLNGGNVVLYNAGGNTLTLAVAADGSATLQRTADAGAGLTYDCSLWLVWV